MADSFNEYIIIFLLIAQIFAYSAAVQYTWVKLIFFKGQGVDLFERHLIDSGIKSYIRKWMEKKLCIKVFYIFRNIYL